MRGASRLAAAAAFEVESRAKYLPAMIAAGEVEKSDAEADQAAWRAIAAMLAVAAGRGGRVNPRLEVTDLPWPTLELAAARAVQRLSERADAAPADARLVERRDAAAAIAAWLAVERAFWTGEWAKKTAA